MDPERWNKIEVLCYEAKDLEGEARRTYLLNSCGNDRDLYTEIISLLEQSETGSLPQPFVLIRSSSVFSGEKSLSEQMIGPYRLIREIASGGMGQVYLAVRNDEQFRRYVALKVIRKELVNENILGRFYEERQILASLNHPYIARLFDGGTTAGEIPWFAMEFVDGVPVTEYLNRRKASAETKIRMFLKICSAVHYAHQNLVIHRDLKPENILINEKGDPKLLDFGIAKLMSFDLTSHKTQFQNRIMTPEYASPEQVRHDPITTSSDVYSLGVLLYKLLTGSLPYEFRKRSPVAIEKTVCNTIPQLPSTKTGSKMLKGDLDSIIMKALKKDPSERYSSAEQLAGDLNRYLENRPVLAQTDSIGYQVRKFITRNKWSVAVSAVIAVLFITFTVVTLLQSKAIQARAVEAEQQRERAEQVSLFLTDLFELVNPDQAQDNALSAVELLQRGAERVETEFGDQPRQQAALYLVISDVFESLGSFDEALNIATKANRLLNEIHEDIHPDIARSLNSIGWLYRQKAVYTEADSFLTAALAMRRDLYGSGHPDVARSLNDLAVLKQSMGDYTATDSLLQESIEIRKALSDEPNEALGVALSNYAALKYGLGDFEAAENLMKQALEVLLIAVGDRDMQTANVMSNLAAIMMVQNQYDSAIDYYRQALEVRLTILGPDHPDIASSYAHLGNLHRGTGNYSEAEELLKNALRLRLDILGQKHEQTVDTYRLLGLLYESKGEVGTALTYYEEAISGYRSLSIEGNPELAEALHNSGVLYLGNGNPGSAEPLLRDALNLRKKILGETHALTITSMIHLGVCLSKMGRISESGTLLSSGLEILDETGNGLPSLRSLALKTLEGLE